MVPHFKREVHRDTLEILDYAETACEEQNASSFSYTLVSLSFLGMAQRDLKFIKLIVSNYG